MNLKFTCPNCKNHRLEEVMTNVTLTSVISKIDADGDHEYDKAINEDGEISQYQCVHCGYIIGEQHGGPITDCDEMAEWVKENCPQEG